VVIDLRRQDSFSQLDRYEYSYLVHTAWDQRSKNIYENSVLLSKNLLAHAVKKKIKGIIFLSSSFSSTTANIQYTRSKLEIENLLFDIEIPFVIFRPDMIYASDEPKILQQISMMKMGLAICIGKGMSLRSPTHILDLIYVIEEILATDKFTNRVYEIGSPIPCSQKAFLDTISKANKLNPLVIHIPKWLASSLFRFSGIVDPEQAKTIDIDRVADLTRFREDFSITPRAFSQDSVS